MNEASTSAVVDAVSLFRNEQAQLRAEMHQLRAEMRQEIATMQIRLTTTLIAAMGIFSGIIIAVIKYVP